MVHPRPFSRASALAGLILAVACSPRTDGDGAPEDRPTRPAPASAAPPALVAFTPEGLGPLRIGGPVPTAWPARETCRDLAADGYPHAYAIVREGKIRRITALPGSGIRLEEGIGPGSPEAKLVAAIPGLRSEPHKYLPSPARMLTVPFSGDGPTLRFEIDGHRRIAAMSAGVLPEIGFVEGCG